MNQPEIKSEIKYWIIAVLVLIIVLILREQQTPPYTPANPSTAPITINNAPPTTIIYISQTSTPMPMIDGMPTVEILYTQDESGNFILPNGTVVPLGKSEMKDENDWNEAERKWATAVNNGSFTFPKQ